MSVRHFFLPSGDRFSLPEEWWGAAGMNGFIARADAFRAMSAPNTSIVALRDIAPPDMVQRQHRGPGGFERHRMVAVLKEIASDSPIYPIEIMEWPHSVGAKHYRYILANGAHRFFASIAAGFVAIPTVEGFVLEDRRPKTANSN